MNWEVGDKIQCVIDDATELLAKDREYTIRKIVNVGRDVVLLEGVIGAWPVERFKFISKAVSINNGELM